jgi:hypothetical protein
MLLVHVDLAAIRLASVLQIVHVAIPMVETVNNRDNMGLFRIRDLAQMMGLRNTSIKDVAKDLQACGNFVCRDIFSLHAMRERLSQAIAP